MVHEVEHGLHVPEGHPLEVEQGVLVLVTPQHILKKWTTGTENNFVCLQLFVITSESNVKELLLIPDVSKSRTNVSLKIIPAETELLRSHFKSGAGSLFQAVTAGLASLCSITSPESCPRGSTF